MSRPVPRRGDIWWVTLGGRYGTRPAVVVTAGHLLPRLGNVTVVTVTGRVRGTPSEVLLPASKYDLSVDSAANCNNILTAEKTNLIDFVSRLDAADEAKLDVAIRHALAL